MDGECQAGVQAVTWDGQDIKGRRVANGIYFAKLQAEEDVQVRKVVLTR
jgi:flagellar hook assembly protein FlgD